MKKDKDVKKQVFDILELHKQARNSDKYLIMMIFYTFYKECGGYYVDNLGKKRWGCLLTHKNAPSSESIRRYRQKYQSAGIYMPTSLKVVKQRRLNQGLWRSEMAKDI